MSVSSPWNSFRHQEQKDAFHNFALKLAWLRHIASPFEYFFKTSHLFPNERSRTYSTRVRWLPKWMPKGTKPSPEASTSSGVTHFRMTHLKTAWGLWSCWCVDGGRVYTVCYDWKIVVLSFLPSQQCARQLRSHPDHSMQWGSKAFSAAKLFPELGCFSI